MSDRTESSATVGVQFAQSALALSPPQRILLLGGLTLTLVGLLSGEWFALFISHVLNAELRTTWASIIQLSAERHVTEIDLALEQLRTIASARAQAMSLHSHIGAYGLLAALVAIFSVHLRASGAGSLTALQAMLILAGAAIQSAGMLFPDVHIAGWLSFSDAATPLLALGIASVCIGKQRERQSIRTALDSMPNDRVESDLRMLLFGSVLVLLGLAFGLYLAWRHIEYEQPALVAAFEEMFRMIEAGSVERATAAFMEYKKIQTRIDITAASHSHAVGLGMLIVVLGFVIGAANLSRTAAATARVLALAGGFLLPVFVYLAPRHGFVFALFADAAGALMILALLIILKGLAMNASWRRSND